MYYQYYQEDISKSLLQKLTVVYLLPNTCNYCILLCNLPRIARNAGN